VSTSSKIVWILALAGAGVGVYLWYRSQQDDSSDADSSDDGSADGGGVLGSITSLAQTVTSRVTALVGSRGYRNNNPGNLRYIASNPWNGQTGNDGGYGVYDTPENGTRALGHQLQAYSDEGYATVSAIITHWAPSSDGNDTAAYIADVADQLGVGADDSIDVYTVLPQLAAAIAKHENGYLDASYDWSWTQDP
jgi:hypothetical protein